VKNMKQKPDAIAVMTRLRDATQAFSIQLRVELREISLNSFPVLAISVTMSEYLPRAVVG
ncbi:hypothetical protein Q6248_29995, partial [Klebsiella pneumoniae]|uniref:hypothetical protein n=1 Tax=Klebsiella pneumoniae TaxID=573 RepID=UPI0027300EBD